MRRLHTKVYRLSKAREAHWESIAVQSRKIAMGVVVAYIAVGLFGVLLSSGVLVTSETVKISGVLASANLGVYSDSACTQRVTAVDWGAVAPGASVSRTFFIKNIGTTPVTLSFSATNWSPAAANGQVTASWSHEGTQLSAGQVTAASITLNVRSTASGFTTFSVDAVITGTG